MLMLQVFQVRVNLSKRAIRRNLLHELWNVKYNL